MPPALFALFILEIRSPFFPRLTWTMILLFYTSLHYGMTHTHFPPLWDDRCTPPHPAFFPNLARRDILTGFKNKQDISKWIKRKVVISTTNSINKGRRLERQGKMASNSIWVEHGMGEKSRYETEHIRSAQKARAAIFLKQSS
jgi:hypothetical protein